MMEEYIAQFQHQLWQDTVYQQAALRGPLEREIEALERARRAACRRGPVGWFGLQMVNVAIWFGQIGARVAAARVEPESAA